MSDHEIMDNYEFVAIGPGVKQRWRRQVPSDQVIRLGRSPKSGWAIPWDMRISREHADLMLEGDRLRVRRLPSARNSIYLRGEALNDFTVGPGDDFRIGRTVFHIEMTPLVGMDAERDLSEGGDSLDNLVHQPVEDRLESLLSRIDAQEGNDAAPSSPEGVEDDDLAGRDAPVDAVQESELDALRAEVKALRVLLEMRDADRSEDDAQRPGGDRPTAEGHILKDLVQPPLPEGQFADWVEDVDEGQAEDDSLLDDEAQEDAEIADGGLESDLGLVLENSLPAAAVPIEVVDGAAFGNYELLDQIHRGGTGQILKASHRYLDRLAAIKVLSGTTGQSEENVTRFRCRASILASSNHPNFLTAYDSGELDGTNYLIMEYVGGPDLVRLLKSEDLDVPTAVDYIIQAAQALEYAHERNIVHRNVNPSHLLIDRKGVVKLTGWGLALYIGNQQLRAFERPGTPVGTLDYMAPEQIIDSWTVDHRADIYSLGCTLFAILAKRVVYPIAWQRRKATAQRFQPAPSLKELRPDAPDSLDDVYRKMMAKEAEDRFQTMAEAIDALRKVDTGQ